MVEVLTLKSWVFKSFAFRLLVKVNGILLLLKLNSASRHFVGRQKEEGERETKNACLRVLPKFGVCEMYLQETYANSKHFDEGRERSGEEILIHFLDLQVIHSELCTEQQCFMTRISCTHFIYRFIFHFCMKRISAFLWGGLISLNILWL